MLAVQGTQVRTARPEMNWDHLRETVLMMELAVGQIEAAMRDSDSSVQALTETFTTMAQSLKIVDEHIDSLAEGGAKNALRQSTVGMAGKVHQAIVAFQFYDRLAQRLAHVSISLDGLAQLVSDQQQIEDAAAWVALQDRIRSRYSMPEEIEMFEAVLLHGKPVKQALQDFMNRVKSDESDIELF